MVLVVRFYPPTVCQGLLKPSTRRSLKTLWRNDHMIRPTNLIVAPDDSDAIDAGRVEILLRRVVVDDRDRGFDARDVGHAAHDEPDAVGGA